MNIFEDAERVMSGADKTQPSGKKGMTVTREENHKELDQIIEQTIGDINNKDDKKKELEEKIYSIVAVSLPEMFFFETVHMLEKIVVKLNVNHLFYKYIFEPLCETILAMYEDSDINQGAGTIEQRKIRQAFMLLLLSLLKVNLFLKMNIKAN